MAGFKAPDFNERNAAARDARQRALEQLRAKPALDPEVVAERAAKQAAKEAADAEKRAAKQAAIAAAKAEREAAIAAKAAEEEAAAVAEAEAIAARNPARLLPTEAELKAARDARYAARKARKR